MVPEGKNSPAVQQNTLVTIDIGDGALAGGCAGEAWIEGAETSAAMGGRKECEG